MIVYVVMLFHFDWRIEEIFSTREKAASYVDFHEGLENHNRYKIAEWEVK